jgi:FMN phosphatase YigB (HAD superfamily)
MIKTIISDFSRVLLFPKDASYTDSLNALNNHLLSENPDYDFYDYFFLNNELLTFYAEINISTPVYIFTSDKIQDHPAIKEIISKSVSGILSAKEMNVQKTNSLAYERVLNELSLRPPEVVFIDDQETNIDAALIAGMNVIQYVENQTTIEEIRKLIS